MKPPFKPDIKMCVGKSSHKWTFTGVNGVQNAKFVYFQLNLVVVENACDLIAFTV